MSRISACPDPRAFGLIFTPIIFHRRTWPSRKRSAHEFGGPCLRGSWVEKDGQTMSILRGFWALTPDCDPCMASVAASAPGQPILPWAWPLSGFAGRLRARGGSQPTASSFAGPSPSRALTVHGFDPALVRDEQAMPFTADAVWMSLQRIEASNALPNPVREVGRWI